LDLATLRVLEEALASFGGCVIVVSHDRYFLNRVCTSILSFEGQGVLNFQVGSYDYFLEKKLQHKLVDQAWQQSSQASASEQTREKNSQNSARKKLTNKERQELANMEQTILDHEGRLAAIEAAFVAADFYEKHADNWQDLEAQMEALKVQIPALYDRWEELESRDG
jgi:ATP-binding cassette subfamily F protein uup